MPTEVPRREKLLKLATVDLFSASRGDDSHVLQMCRDAIESVSALCVQDARDAILGELKAKIHARLDRLGGAHRVGPRLVDDALLEILEEM